MASKRKSPRPAVANLPDGIGLESMLSLHRMLLAAPWAAHDWIAERCPRLDDGEGGLWRAVQTYPEWVAMYTSAAFAGKKTGEMALSTGDWLQCVCDWFGDLEARVASDGTQV